MIDLRGGNNRNPWASFLPQMFQQMMMMGIKSKYDMEALKAKSIYDAGVRDEKRTYTEKQDVEKFNRELEGKRSEAAIGRHYAKPEWKQVVRNGKTYWTQATKKLEGQEAKPEKESATWEQLPDITTPSGDTIKQQKNSLGKIERYTVRKNKDGSETKLQLKTKKYTGKDGKTYGQLMTFNPKTGATKNSGEPFEVPKTSNIWDFLGGGPGTGDTETQDDIGPLVDQIKQLQDALQSIQGQ